MKKRILTFSLSVLMISSGLAMAGSAWNPLFNGKNLEGWQGDINGYQAVDGLLRCTQKGGKIYTDKEYGDFVLRFDFRLTAGANNGLGIRTPLNANPAYAGMELQILDNSAERYAKLKDYQYHASIYGVVPAKRGAQKPVGEWNTQEVIAMGDHIKVTLNGEVIMDAYLTDIVPKDGKGHPGLKNKKGYIGFLGHGAAVDFRNIAVREFAPADPMPKFTALNQPPEGFEALFNGQDLSGWKGLVANPPKRAKMSPEQLAEAQAKADESMHKNWTVQEGVLVFSGTGQSLCTAKDYADFEMYVDWLILDKGDSGIYLRGSPQVQIWDPNQHKIGSGGMYNNKKNPSKPMVMADNPIGEWNTLFIRMINERVTIYLNGKQVVDNTILENYWERNKPIYRSGQLELQNHGNTLKFRNIFLRELPR